MSKVLKQCCNEFIITALFLLVLFPVYSQNSVGVRFTPNIISPTKINNPSPASIYGTKRISFDAGIDFTYMLNDKLGFITGIDVGLVDWDYSFKAPRNAFGTKQGEGDIEFWEAFDKYLYNAVSARILYKFALKNIRFHSFLGPSLRFYHGEVDPTNWGYAFNREASFDSEDPNSGSPDLWVNIPTVGNRLHLNISTGIGIEKKLSERSNLVFGLRKNWGVKPIGKGSLLVQMYDQIYNGNFNTRSNYIGLDLMFNYNLAGKLQKVLVSKPLDLSEVGRFRKTLFMEFLGNGGCLTGNFDMRLNPDRNNGFGIRAGLGSGYPYFTGTQFHRYISVPLGLNFIVGKRRSGLESGIGVTTQFAPRKVIDDPKVYAETYLNLGYRFQPLRNDLMFRVMWTPYFYKSGVVADWGGVSLGYSFK